MPLHFHIYCTIVDNFGDIGVCWRLARQLVNEHSCAVTLWVDDWFSARQLIRELPDQPALTLVGGVCIDAWAHVDPARDVTGDVLIEGFACTLPAATLAQLAARPNKPVWVNLDYFSAEDWIPSFHGLSGDDAEVKATRWFFFPGVHANSGGILREADLVARRDRWLAQSPADTAAFLAQWGLALPKNGLTMLCFAYQHAPYAAWLDAI
ncbi:MAG: elongation factor P maturation arginine rhamnosyltransferase EarP, partial [Anaerolineae bacterium]|nr:elongation factor P maturation arginine rhamnosyltransferase EarP [Anaerolineae bacterium]